MRLFLSRFRTGPKSNAQILQKFSHYGMAAFSYKLIYLELLEIL